MAAQDDHAQAVILKVSKAIRYGVHATVIHRWKKEAIASMEAGFADKLEKVDGDHKAEIRELHAKIGQQSVELDFLLSASSRLGLGDVKKW